MKPSFIIAMLLFVLAGCKEAPNQKTMDASETGTPVGQGTKAEPSKEWYQEKGMQYAMATQAALGKTLQNKIQEAGIEQALAFCKVEALPITDSLSRKFGVSISRISDRPRNPVNTATDEEMKFISNFKSEVSSGKSPEALVVRQGDHTNFYYPILTNNLCLKCHGTPAEDIQQDVLTAIENLYPEDLASGYSVNELRGLWKVSFVED